VLRALSARRSKKRRASASAAVSASGEIAPTARNWRTALMLPHPLFATLVADRAALADMSLEALNERRPAILAACTPPIAFAAQTGALLGDGLHYEQRIAERGEIATREGDAHDFFNAMVWLAHAEIKLAMNARQVADISRVGPKRRTRGQCALTHFDEAGAIVWIAEPSLLAPWDTHDWTALFLKHASSWGVTIGVTLVGHALFEYAIEHEAMPVAKALVVRVDRDALGARMAGSVALGAWPEAERVVAGAIAHGDLLADPQELRPLPLAGIPGWSGVEQSETFYASAPCFRPLRAGRRYPPPSAFGEAMM